MTPEEEVRSPRCPVWFCPLLAARCHQVSEALSQPPCASSLQGASPARRVLFAEDDRALAIYASEAMAGWGLQVTCAEEGLRGKALALEGGWDCIVLDRRLPGVDGLSILKEIRLSGLECPVLFLTTMDGVRDRVEGLRSGADDYLVKPFALPELKARIETLLRRAEQPLNTARLIFADLELDLVRREVFRRGVKLYIQSQELRLLEYFMRHPLIVISRAMLLQHVWGIDFPVHTNLVETHVSRLRERLGREAPALLHTVKGQGYVLRGHG
ncbi:response regulator transcription factor [Asaia spathodeae]|uniref:Response regulator transcription factor n=1 Tax=Asaia spathodeae TaxID=657016 RepID=A0ABX2P5T6_9PROT